MRGAPGLRQTAGMKSENDPPLPAGEGRGEGHPFFVLRARQLRRTLTKAERALWRRLRARQLLGAKFRRQRPLGSFVVDFVAADESLVVEIDGGQHALDEIRARDDERTRAIEARGYRVLRFWNGDVLGNPDGVLEVIGRVLRERRPPSP